MQRLTFSGRKSSGKAEVGRSNSPRATRTVQAGSNAIFGEEVAPFTSLLILRDLASPDREQ
jgi:hypothetical protein